MRGNPGSFPKRERSVEFLGPAVRAADRSSAIDDFGRPEMRQAGGPDAPLPGQKEPWKPAYRGQGKAFGPSDMAT